jgi:membrane-associated phospholipid phosphatase
VFRAPRSPHPPFQWLLLALSLSVAAPARAEVQPLQVAPRLDAPVTLAAGALALVLTSRFAAPTGCRLCGTGGFDESVQERVVWRDARAARTASSLLANGIVPAAALLNSAVFSWRGGDRSAFWGDALVLTEVAALATGLDEVAKDAFARRRPSAGRSSRGAADESFYSGHTSFAFALAAGAGTISTLRGYPSAPWVWGVGMTLASGVGYLRVAGNAHWTTDVLAGAAAGGAIGFAVPWLFHRVSHSRRIDLAPAPGGLAVHF